MARSLTISEKRLLGWEPAEHHVYSYDDDGRVATVTVTRDSEWDGYERNKMLALAEFEAHICQCGLHESVADADPYVRLEPRVCPVCAGIDQGHRAIEADDEKRVKAMGDTPPPSAPLPNDGRHLHLRPLSPEEVAAITKS